MPPSAEPALNDAERARVRLARIAPASPERDRPARDRPGEADAPRRPRSGQDRPRHGTGKRDGFRLGWVGWLLIEAAAVAVVAGAVLVWPPASACREQEAKMGFYAGDTLGKCIRRGVAARIEAVDQRIKMAVRGSGT